MVLNLASAPLFFPLASLNYSRRTLSSAINKPAVPVLSKPTIVVDDEARLAIINRTNRLVIPVLLVSCQIHILRPVSRATRQSLARPSSAPK